MTRADDTWSLTANESAEIAEAIGVDWAEVPFDPALFHAGLVTELARAREAGEGADAHGCARLVLARLAIDLDHYGAGVVPEGGPPPV